MSFPTTPEATSVQIKAISRNLRSESRSGRTQTRSLGNQKWQITMSYRDLTRAQFGPVFGFVAGKGVGATTFTVAPSEVSSSPTASGSVTATSTAAGATSVTIAGLTGTLKAGSFVKFASHEKVYMVTADRSGAGAMSISPALQETASGVVIIDDVPFTVRLSADVQEWSLDGFDRYNFEVDMIEA